jgi:hypothetical protein
LGFVSLSAEAFPEMIRQHYVNCSACHVSQTGGGVLNAYGRSISSELLSTWGGAEEARAFYAIDPEKVGTWLNLGGDVRTIQLHEENSAVKSGRFFWMQGGIDAAVTVDKITAMMTIGKVVGQQKESGQTLDFVSPKYYLSGQISDEFSVRAGRFVPQFGLQIPQHEFYIKDNLLIGQGSERDSVEAIYNGETWNFDLAIAKSNEKSTVRDVEKSVSGQILRTVNDSHKIGISLWDGNADQFKRRMVGLHAISGWSEKFYTLAEIDHINSKSVATNIETKSAYQLLKLGYEFHKGIHAQIVQQWGKADLDKSSESQSVGAGFLWYPRPHFEFEMLWSKQRTLGVDNQWEDYAYLLTHFYF